MALALTLSLVKCFPFVTVSGVGLIRQEVHGGTLYRSFCPAGTSQMLAKSESA